MGRKQNPLSARVKRMMQADVEVGKIAGPTPVLISKALELFLKEFCDGASEVAVQRKQYVMQAQRMDFLKEKFAEVPDLPEHVPGAVAPAPKPKASKPKKRPRLDEPETQAPAAKGAKDAPILQQIPDSTPFTAPPVASASQAAGVMESPMAAWGGPEAAAAAAAAAPATGVGAAAGPAGVGDGAGTETSAPAPATAATEGSVDVPPVGLPASVTGQQQAPQPVAAEEDDYDAD